MESISPSWNFKIENGVEEIVQLGGAVPLYMVYPIKVPGPTYDPQSAAESDFWAQREE